MSRKLPSESSMYTSRPKHRGKKSIDRDGDMADMTARKDAAQSLCPCDIFHVKISDFDVSSGKKLHVHWETCDK